MAPAVENKPLETAGAATAQPEKEQPKEQGRTGQTAAPNVDQKWEQRFIEQDKKWTALLTDQQQRHESAMRTAQQGFEERFRQLEETSRSQLQELSEQIGANGQRMSKVIAHLRDLHGFSEA